MNDLKHTVEDVVSLPSTHMPEPEEVVEEVDPSPGFDIEALEYYRRLHGRHTFYARAALLAVIVGMLGANMWLSQRNYNALLVNMDQSRLAQAELLDRHLAAAELQHERIDVLEARLAALQPPNAPAAAPTEAAPGAITP